jgi:hypothetical protein
MTDERKRATPAEARADRLTAWLERALPLRADPRTVARVVAADGATFASCGGQGDPDEWRARRDTIIEAVNALAAQRAKAPPDIAAIEEAAYKRGWNDREDDFIAGVERIVPPELLEPAGASAGVALSDASRRERRGELIASMSVDDIEQAITRHWPAAAFYFAELLAGRNSLDDARDDLASLIEAANLLEDRHGR